MFDVFWTALITRSFSSLENCYCLSFHIETLMTYSNVSCSVRPFRYCAIIKSFVHSSYFCYTIMKVTTDQRTSLEHTLRVFAMYNGFETFFEVAFTFLAPCPLLDTKFGQSHNNGLCFYWCKIPLDGSDRFWYINHWTWGKYLFGPPGQMVTDAMAVGDNCT